MTTAPPVSQLLAPWAFLPGGQLLTKYGHLITVYRCGGVDADGVTPDERATAAARFAGALRLLDERFRLYHYLVKTPIQPVDQPAATTGGALERVVAGRAAHLAAGGPQYDVQRFLALVYEPPGTALSWWQRLSAPTVGKTLRADLDTAVGVLDRTAQHVEAQLADTLALVRLTDQQTFDFLRALVNYDGPAIRLPHELFIDYFMTEAAVERAPNQRADHLAVGPARVKVLTLKDAPSTSGPHDLEPLYRLPCALIACLEWRRLPLATVKSDLKWRRRFAFSKREDVLAGTVSDEEWSALIDQGQDAIVKQLGLLSVDLENGRVMGDCSLTLVLHDPDGKVVDNAAAQARALLAVRDGIFTEETDATNNLLNAWIAIVPGNSAHNLRRLWLLDTNAADLAFLYALDSGKRDTAIMTFETAARVPFHFDPMVADVGHTLVLGATGSGKSFLVNSLIAHWQQRQVDTVVIDLGHSYRRLAQAFGGSYVELRLQSDVHINPFVGEVTPDHLLFLQAFVRLLLERDGRPLSVADDAQLRGALVDVCRLPLPSRRLMMLRGQLHGDLNRRLKPWCHGNDDSRYADVFDHADDTLTLSRLQVFEFEAMADRPDLVEPVLFCLLHRLNARVRARTGVLCAMDEAWKFIQHPAFRRYVHDSLNMWRKQHASMILATLSIKNFEDDDLRQTILDACQTKFFLANRDLDRSLYARVFGLNDTALALLTSLRTDPKGHVLLCRSGLTKVLEWNVDPYAAWLFGGAGAVPA